MENETPAHRCPCRIKPMIISIYINGKDSIQKIRAKA